MHAARPGLFVAPPGSPAPGTQPLPALTADRTVYVNSATGSNANDGLTPGTAWQTLQFAWDDRQKYGELRATYTLNLLGAGPYSMPVMGSSVANVANGMMLFIGDTPTVLASGTFTGDFAVNVLPTSAIGAVDAFKDAFVEVTSGNLAGAIFQLTANTGTSVTVANKQARATAALPVANGDTFTIWRPTTVVDIPNTLAAGIYPGAYDWAGGGSNNYAQANNAATHWFYRLRFSGIIGTALRSSVGFMACYSAAAAWIWTQSNVQCGALSNGARFGTANTNNNRLYGAGLITGAGTTLIGAAVAIAGVLSLFGSFSTSAVSGTTALNHTGGRIDPGAGTIDFGQQCLYFMGNVGNSWTHFSKGILASNGASAVLQGAGIFAVTSGSCLRASRGAIIRDDSTMTGGTTDAAGYGIDALNGGRVYVTNKAFVLTGGTANADVRTNAFTKANAYFAANGDALGDPAFGGCVARISTS